MNDRDRLRRIAQIAVEVENRCSASDDWGTMREIMRDELNEIYRLAARLDTVRPA